MGITEKLMGEVAYLRTENARLQKMCALSTGEKPPAGPLNLSKRNEK